MSERLERRFPNLRTTPYEETSDATPDCNCVAWAAGDDARWWASWASAELPLAYWPGSVPPEDTLQAWVTLFASLGYVVTDDRAPERGVERIAIYADADGRPQHVARQLPDGMWTSKLGKGVDISHQLPGLEGDRYGTIVRIMRR